MSWPLYDPLQGACMFLGGWVVGGLNPHTHHQQKSVMVCWWAVGGRQVERLRLSTLGFKVSSCVNWPHLATFLTSCHYCHFTWEPGQQRGSTDNRLTPDAVHLIDISTDNDPFSALQWWLHREALGGGKYRRNVTPGKSARRKALPDERRVSGSSLPPLCPG